MGKIVQCLCAPCSATTVAQMAILQELCVSTDRDDFSEQRPQDELQGSQSV